MLHCLFQETKHYEVPVPGRPTEECGQQESDRRSTGCLVINSVLFAVDPAEHIGKCGSQREEADRVKYCRHRFPVVAHLEEEGIRNGMSTVKFERVIHSLLGGGVSKRMEHLYFDLPIDRCPRFSILVFDNKQITFN